QHERNPMRCRRGFTLIELIVAMGLIVIVLTVLAQAFGKGLETFGRLKALGDMADRLRAAAHVIRRDLRDEHFEGSFRLSANDFGTLRRPSAGFFAIKQFAPSVLEGQSNGINSYCSPPPVPPGSHVLYFTVKRRGNTEQDFFYANVPSGFPLMQ